VAVGRAVERNVSGGTRGRDPAVLAGRLVGESGGRETESGAGSPQLLRQVGMEVLREQLDPAAWAQALVESQGSRDDAISHYARFRLESLAEEAGERSGKKKNLEVRRRKSFRDYRSVPHLPPGELAERSAVSFVDALFWHLVAMVGMMGCAMAAGLLWPALQSSLSWLALVLAVVVMQLIPAAGWWAGRGVLHGVTYAQAAQMAACLAMLGSLALGFNLLLMPSMEQSATLEQELQAEERLYAFAQSAREKTPALEQEPARERESGQGKGLAATEED
jgi:hypothetical protein